MNEINRRRAIGVIAAALFAHRNRCEHCGRRIGVDMGRGQSRTGIVTVRSADGVYDYFHPPLAAQHIDITFKVYSSGARLVE